MISKKAMSTNRRCVGLTNESGFVVSRSAREESPRAARTLRKNGALPACPTASMPSSTAATTASAVANGRSAGTMQRTAAPASSPAIAAAIRSRLLPKAHSEAPTAMRGQAQPKWAMHMPSVVAAGDAASMPAHQTGVPTAMSAVEQTPSIQACVRWGNFKASRATSAYPAAAATAWMLTEGAHRSCAGGNRTFMSSQTSTELAVVPSAASARAANRPRDGSRESSAAPEARVCPISGERAAVRACPVMGPPRLLRRLPHLLSRIVGWCLSPSRPVRGPFRRASYRSPRRARMRIGAIGQSAGGGLRPESLARSGLLGTIFDQRFPNAQLVGG